MGRGRGANLAEMFECIIISFTTAPLGMQTPDMMLICSKDPSDERSDVICAASALPSTSPTTLLDTDQQWRPNTDADVLRQYI